MFCSCMRHNTCMLMPVDAVSAHACLLQLHMLGDLDFDVNVASLSRDKDLLERAKMAYNAGSGSTTSQNNGLASLFARMCRCTDIFVLRYSVQVISSASSSLSKATRALANKAAASRSSHRHAAVVATPAKLV